MIFLLPLALPLAETALVTLYGIAMIAVANHKEQGAKIDKEIEDIQYFKNQTLLNQWANTKNELALIAQNEAITEINGAIEQESYKVDNWIQYNNQINLDNINKFKQQEIKIFEINQDIYEQNERLNFLEWQINNQEDINYEALNQNFINLRDQDKILINAVEQLEEIKDKQATRINDLIYSLNALSEKEQADTNYLITSFTNYQYQSNDRLNNLENNPIIQNPTSLNTFDTRIKILEDNDMDEQKMTNLLTTIVLDPLQLIPTKTIELLKPRNELLLDDLSRQNKTLLDSLTRQNEELNRKAFGHFTDLNKHLDDLETNNNSEAHTNLVKLKTNQEANTREIKTLLTTEITTINEQIKTGTEQLLNNNNDTKRTVTDLGLKLGTMAVVTGSIATQTAPDALRSAAQTGACQALNGGCGSGVRQNELNNALNPINNNLNGVNTLLNGADLANTTAKLTDLTNLFNKFKAKFDKLYENLGVDRALRALDTALLLHNAMMLSNNLFQTLGDTVDVSLQALKIPFKDDLGNEIGFTESATTQIKYAIMGIIGSENYTNIVATWNSANRIYQSGANLLYSVRSLFDESLDYSEMIGEMLGKFMNSARKDGLVSENAYPTQTERLPPKSKFRKNFDAFDENIEEAEEALDSIAMIASSTLGIVSEMNELSENSVEFAKVLNDEEKVLDGIYKKDKEDSAVPITDATRDDYKPM